MPRPHFMNWTAAAALMERLSLKSKSLKKEEKTKEGVLKTYSRILNRLLNTYATDNVIAEADIDISRFVQPMNSTPLQFADVLLMKTSHVLQVSMTRC